jgi:hypothetical protein
VNHEMPAEEAIFFSEKLKQTFFFVNRDITFLFSVICNQYSRFTRGTGSNVKGWGQPFQKGTSFFWAAIFVKLYYMDTRLLVAIIGRQTSTLILNNFIRCTVLKAQNKISKRTYIA